MTVQIRFTATNDNPDTIWNRLAARLGREPTNAEARDEVLRILRDEPEPAASRPTSPDHPERTRS